MLTKEKLIQLMTDLESETVDRTRAFDKAEKMGRQSALLPMTFPDAAFPDIYCLV